MSSYNENSIKVLQGLEGCRKRPTMYLGDRGNSMVFNAVKEFVDNAFDEAIAGRNDTIRLYSNPKNNEYIIADNAEGIPTGKNKETGESTLTVVFTRLHAGGKFNDSSYKRSVGTHGVGSAASNAIGELLEVWTNRNSVWFYQKFEKGIPVTGVIKKKPNTEILSKLKVNTNSLKDMGTIIYYKPDQSIVSEDATSRKKNKKFAYLESRRVLIWLRDLANLNPGIKVYATFVGKSKTINKLFYNKGTITEYVLKVIEEKGASVLHKKPLVLETQELKMSLFWTDSSDTSMFKTYVNSNPTHDHGTHEQGFVQALGKAIKPYILKKDKFKTRDLLAGLAGVFDYGMSEAEFHGQLKGKLVSNVSKDVDNIVYPVIKEFFESNKRLPKQLIKRAVALTKATDQLKTLMKSVSDVKKSKRNLLLPNVLYTATKAKPQDREIFIVEGGSAGGCFTADTPVMLADGSTLTYKGVLNESKKGYTLYGIAYDIKNDKFEKVPFVEPRIVKHTKELTVVKTNDGEEWECTRDHPWLVVRDKDKKYVKAEKLRVNDILISKDKKIKVQYVENISLSVPVPVYDATVEHYHNYCLGNGVVVHNTAKEARYHEYQEVFKLTGKIANALRTPLPKLLSSKAIQNILVAFGVDTKTLDTSKSLDTAVFNVDKLRIGRVYLLSDADDDGKHINVLLLALIYRILPDLIRQGRVYIVDAPLFFAFHNNIRYFGSTYEECFSQLPKGAPKDIVTRAKGWGEINSDMLRHVAFDQNNRTLIKVSMPDKDKELEYFCGLVGENVSLRRELLGL